MLHPLRPYRRPSGHIQKLYSRVQWFFSKNPVYNLKTLRFGLRKFIFRLFHLSQIARKLELMEKNWFQIWNQRFKFLQDQLKNPMQQKVEIFLFPSVIQIRTLRTHINQSRGSISQIVALGLLEVMCSAYRAIWLADIFTDLNFQHRKLWPNLVHIWRERGISISNAVYQANVII